MTVTAIIPHWNRAALLETLLAQLPQQTRPFDRILVVDNGSTDGSPEIAERMGAEVIRLDRNHGFAAAVNRGISAAATDWVAILNNDVSLHPAWLERLLSALTTPEDVRAAALKAVETRPEDLLAEYTRRFANVLNADNAAELFPQYSASLESRARFRVAVHPAAQWILDELFRRALANPAVKEVVFTAGGNGAGKTSGAPSGDIVYDSTLNNAEHARLSIQRCLDAHKVVQVDYVYRPIADSFRGVLDRSKTEGRVAAVATVIKTHAEAARTVAGLHQHFAADPRVTFRFIDNSGPEAAIRDVALTRAEDYAGSRDALHRILESERASLPAAVYQAAAGPGVGSQSGRQRPADRRKPQQAPQEKTEPSHLNSAFATGKILSAQDPSILDGAWDAVSRAACPVRIGSGLPDGPAWNTPRPIHIASMTACLFRREVFSAIGPLDERFVSYLEDVDFGLRCVQAGLTGLYVPSAIAWHQGSATWGAWSPDTVRQLARNQVLLTAKHFRHQSRRAILAGQLLWGLLAFRHGCGAAWLAGRREGNRLAHAAANATAPSPALTDFLRSSEAEILALQPGLYWKLYRWLAGQP